MFLNELLVWFVILAPFFCLLLSAFVAVATYRAVVSWRDAEALREAAQPNSVPRNPAGRARRRTVRNGVAGGEDQEVGLNAAVPRARQKAPSRGISRSLADAMVQTSFMLFRRPSDRSIDEAGPSRPSTHIVPPSSSNLPGPSARRQATPGPSGSRLDAPGSSAARRHAPRPPTPGPSAPRAVVCDAFTSPVGIPTTPGSSSRHVSGRGELSMSSPIKRRVRKFTPRAKTKPEHDHLPAEPSQVVISFYQPEDLGDEPIDAPPDLTHDPELSLGDLFYYMMRDGTYQLWLWSVGRDGQPWWKPVYVGYQREDGKWLLVTPHYKVPGWVTWDRFSRVFDLSPSSRG